MDLGIGGLGFATEIGAGASAIVYKARQLDLDREVAVKVLKVTDEAFIRRFRREAKTLGKLSQNPGIVTVYDTGVTSLGQPYLILELCQSSVLDHLTAAGRFEPMAACQAAAQVADAVADAHENGVVHRDLKPGNVLVSQTGRHMVTDFGISTVTGATMGQTNSVGFTAGYVAPETLTGDDAGPPSDVYALGATLFHMLAGQAPFVDPEQNSNLLALAQRVVNDPVPDLRDRGIPGPISEIVEAAMAKQPDQRPTAAELRDRLLAVAGVPEPVMTTAGTNGGIDPAIGFAGGVDPVTVAVNEADLNHISDLHNTDLHNTDLNHNDATQIVSMEPAVGLAPARPYGAQADSAPGGETGGGQPPASPAPFERGILSDAPAEPALGPTSHERRYQYTADDSRQLGPLLVGALVGLIALVGVGAFLITRSGGDDGSDDGDTAVETVDGPGTSLDGGDNEATGQGAGGNRSGLGPDGSSNNLGATAVDVPSVIGDTATLAESRLAALGFIVNLVDEESSTVRIGDVIRQIPSPGASARRGSVVSIYVSTSEPVDTISVPTVDGMTGTAASSALDDAGLTVSISREFSLTVAKDTVVRTSPEGGTTVNVGSAVILVISNGPPDCAPLEGVTEANARAQLEPAGVTVTSSPVASDTVAEGLVVSCTLSSTTAMLTISSGPDPCTSLIGTDHVSARATLEGLGLTVTETSVASNDVAIGEVVSCMISGSSATVTWAGSTLPTVCPPVDGQTAAAATTALQAAGFTDIEQNLVANAEVPSGAVISCVVTGSTATLTVSSGPADVLVPDVAGMTVTAAGDALVAAGLRRGPSEQVESTRPAGEVVGTRPAIGTAVAPNTLVVLLVSNGGSAMVPVPAVVGSTQGAAIQAITSANLVPSVVTQVVPAGSPNIGLVLQVAPVAGRMVAVGSTVTITVAQAAPDGP